MVVTQSEVYRDDAATTPDVAQKLLKTLRNPGGAMTHLSNDIGNSVPNKSNLALIDVNNGDNKCCPAPKSQAET
jgi:hypothetical protein